MTATTWDPNFKGAGVTLSGSNLVATMTSGAPAGVGATGKLSGKTYFEVAITTLTGVPGIGVCNTSGGSNAGSDNNSVGYRSDGTVKLNNVTLATLAAYVQGNSIGVAVDLVNRLIWFRVGAGSWNNSGANDPATGVGGIDFSTMTLTNAVLPIATGTVNGAVFTAIFTSGFANAAPSGFITADTIQAAGINPEPPLNFPAATSSLASWSTKAPLSGLIFQNTAGAAVSVSVSGLAGGAIVGTPFSAAVSVSGGAAPYTTAAIGTLPPGLSFNTTTNTISGTPTTAGTYTFAVQATDSNGTRGSTQVSIVVSAASSGGGNSSFVA